MPNKSLRIAIYASNTVAFHAKSLDERPLGGTETGIIRLAEALLKLGHNVTVYVPFENPPESQPVYKHYREIKKSEPVDLFISVRDWIPLLYRIQAKKRCLWTGDSYDQFSNFGMGDRRVSHQIDHLFTVSD